MLKEEDDERDTTIGEMIDSGYSTEQEALQKNLSQEIYLVFEKCNLKPREIEILEKRFGLVNGEAQTLETIGQELNVTRERIRQIETKGLKKLRGPSGRHLKEYLD